MSHRFQIKPPFSKAKCTSFAAFFALASALPSHAGNSQSTKEVSERVAPQAATPLVAAESSCRPATEASESFARAPAGRLSSHFRKDFFFPYERYPEAKIPDPVGGGRVQVVGTARTSGMISAIQLGEESIESLVSQGVIDWYHIWPKTVVAGEPVWFSFHSRNPRFTEGFAFSLAIETPQQSALQGMVRLSRADLDLTYVTTSSDYRQLIIHLKNNGTDAKRIRSLLVNGQDASPHVCRPEVVLAAGDTALIEVPFDTALTLGTAWTVVVSMEDGTEVVGAGRVIPAHFPIVTWPSSAECPFPGTDQANYNKHRALGIDSYIIQGPYEKCGGASGPDVARQLAETGDFSVIPSHFPPASRLGNQISARMLGDEVDTDMDMDKPNPKLNRLAKESSALWVQEPATPTYIGGSRHRFNGSFAGVTDIQGMDFYVAACAPHVTDFLNGVPLRGAYDYAVATRRNHMPLPTWIYAQGFHEGWNAENPVTKNKTARQPHVDELRIQAFSAIAAGAKGLMWFQTEISEAERTEEYEQSWDELGRINKDIRAVRDYLREGDPTGNAQADSKDVLTDLVRTRSALLLPVINIKHGKRPSDLKCALGANEHWEIESQETDVSFKLPKGFSIGDAFELRHGRILELADPIQTEGRWATLPEVALSSDLSARLFIFAKDRSVRAAIKRNLK